MDIWSSLFGAGVTLVAVWLKSYFESRNKKIELEHDKSLKELELRDREKERKFKVEEKIIEKSIEMHIQAHIKMMEIFLIVNQYYVSSGILVIPDGEKERFKTLLSGLQSWMNLNKLFLNKKISERMSEVIYWASMALSRNIEPPPRADIWKNTYETIKGIQNALEAIFKEYNPFYDLDVKIPKLPA